MPFIDVKISKMINDKEKEIIKDRICDSINIINKPVEYLMVGITDDYNLYFRGKKVDSAYIEVKVFGKLDYNKSNKLSNEINKIIEDICKIDGNNIYISYFETDKWALDGNNF